MQFKTRLRISQKEALCHIQGILGPREIKKRDFSYKFLLTPKAVMHDDVSKPLDRDQGD